MGRKKIAEVLKRGKQFCSSCMKVTMHTPKLGLVYSNRRLCEKCSTSNLIIDIVYNYEE